MIETEMALLMSIANREDPIELDVYGITLGFRLGDNPNMDVRIPLSAAHFDVEGVDDTGFVGGIEIFPHYRINEYIAWGVRFAHNTSISDFPIFDESMTNVNFGDYGRVEHGIWNELVWSLVHRSLLPK